MILGFTGARRGWTPAQARAVRGCLAALPAGAIHGGAEGADTLFDALLVSCGMDPRDILILPASISRMRFWRIAHRMTHDPSLPLARNHVIARDCDRLLATPAIQTEVLRSGTWATIRYARAAEKPITLVFPDGTVKEEL